MITIQAPDSSGLVIQFEADPHYAERNFYIYCGTVELRYQGVLSDPFIEDCRRAVVKYFAGRVYQDEDRTYDDHISRKGESA